MTKEELLRPRYEVVANFWDNPFIVGQVIQMEEFTTPYNLSYAEEERKEKGEDLRCWMTGYIQISDDSSAKYRESAFSEYPRIFCLLAWWDKRDVNELPEYLKEKSTGIIRNVLKYDHLLVHMKHDGIKDDYGVYYIIETAPATEEEYQQYLSSQKA